ncbi:MAG: HD domain-containing protein, partial [Chloroflexota bacterium]|nr:HD domain-containing protein [Chloroflexota bacterium]
MTELRDWLLTLAKETMEREGNNDAAHDHEHIARVITIAESIQAHEGGDLPTIWAAVALHDSGQVRERQHGGDHALIGAEMAGELLSGTAFPQDAIPVVQQAIRDHRMTGGATPRSLEGRILY